MTLYVKSKSNENFESDLSVTISKLQNEFPGISSKK